MSLKENVTCCNNLVMIVSNMNWYIKYPFNEYYKGKAVPLQAWSGPEGSRKLSFQNFLTTAQDGDKVVSPKHRPHLPPGNTRGTHFCLRLVNPRTTTRSEGFMSMKNSNDTIWDRTNDLLICSAVP
jgi:hypothetical protein